LRTLIGCAAGEASASLAPVRPGPWLRLPGKLSKRINETPDSFVSFGLWSRILYHQSQRVSGSHSMNPDFAYNNVKEDNQPAVLFSTVPINKQPRRFASITLNLSSCLVSSMESCNRACYAGTRLIQDMLSSHLWGKPWSVSALYYPPLSPYTALLSPIM